MGLRGRRVKPGTSVAQRGGKKENFKSGRIPFGGASCIADPDFEFRQNISGTDQNIELEGKRPQTNAFFREV